jgi:hypothetical protein
VTNFQRIVKIINIHIEILYFIFKSGAFLSAVSYKEDANKHGTLLAWIGMTDSITLAVLNGALHIAGFCYTICTELRAGMCFAGAYI